MTPAVFLKKADFSDIKFLWRLRNQKYVYRYSRNPKPVVWSEHIKWVVPALLDLTEKSLYIIKVKGVRAGQIRFDKQDKETTEVSISLCKKFHGQGIATEAFKKAVRMLKRTKKARHLIAEIHKDNTASLNLFKKLGFKLKNKKNVWRVYGKRNGEND